MAIKLVLKESLQPTNDRFERNVDIIRDAYKGMGGSSFLVSMIDRFTPENAKILTQIDLEGERGNIMGGVYGKVFPIKNSDLLLKLFSSGIDVNKDVERMLRTAEEVFEGDASLKKMHYFEFGTLGVTSDNISQQVKNRQEKIAKDIRQQRFERGIYEAGTLPNSVKTGEIQQKPSHPYFKYAIMPRVTPFEKSITFKQDPILFSRLSEAVQRAARNAADDISFTDFFDSVMSYFSNALGEYLFYVPPNERKMAVDDFAERLTNFQDTVSKIIHIAYDTFKKEGGTDLHLGNMGFFPQKPDDWFYFDM